MTPEDKDRAYAKMLYWYLRQLRKLLGLSQTAVAKVARTSQSAVADIESGTKDVRLSTLQRIIRALGELMHLCLRDSFHGFAFTIVPTDTGPPHLFVDGIAAFWGWGDRGGNPLVRPCRIEVGLEEQWRKVFEARRSIGHPIEIRPCAVQPSINSLYDLSLFSLLNHPLFEAALAGRERSW